MAMQVKRLADGSETWKPEVRNNSGMVVLPARLSEAEIPYLVLEPTSKYDAIQAVLAAAPKLYGILVLSSVRFDEFVDDAAIRCTAVYSKGDSDSQDDETSADEDADGDDAESKLTVSISTATVHITRAIRQWRADGGADDMAGMIGWNGQRGDNADFAGCDIPVGQCSIQYKRRRRVKNLTPSFVMRCAIAGGKVNSSSWKGWPAGSLMFNGLNYDIPRGASENQKVTCTWDFVFQPGGTAHVNGYTVTKKGWEYVWGVPLTATGVSLAPYISQVVEYVDFENLGL